MSTEFEKEMLEKAYEVLVFDDEISKEHILKLIPELLHIAKTLKKSCLCFQFVQVFHDGRFLGYTLLDKTLAEFYNYMVDRYNHYAALEINELKFPKELCGIVSKYAKLQKIVQ